MAQVNVPQDLESGELLAEKTDRREFIDLIKRMLTMDQVTVSRGGSGWLVLCEGVRVIPCKWLGWTLFDRIVMCNRQRPPCGLPSEILFAPIFFCFWKRKGTNFSTSTNLA